MAIEEYLPQIEIHYPSKLEGKQILLKSLLRSLFMLKKRFLVCPTTKMAFGNSSSCKASFHAQKTIFLISNN